MENVVKLRPRGPVAWSPEGIAERLSQLDQPGAIVTDGKRIGVLPDPRGTTDGIRTLCVYPAMGPEDLGAASFRQSHGVRYAYKTGAMANGIASPELVIAMAKKGLLASYGAGGVPVPQAEKAIAQIRAEVPFTDFAVNLIHAPHEQAMEEGLVDVMHAHGVTLCEASAFMSVQKSIVRYRVKGLRVGPNGEVITKNRVVAKISHPQVAEQFMRPAPAAMLESLLNEGKITPEERHLATRIPVADDITAEADSGGHTDRRPMGALLPLILRLRDRVCAEEGYSIRVGAGGGIGSPRAAAGAFAMGADYVVTGSVNQACLESGSSPIVRDMLSRASMSDCGMAPAADMFEMGVELQVLKRGTMFLSRAKQLYDLYRRYESLDEIPAKIRAELETKTFKRPLDAVWEETKAYFIQRDAAQIERAAGDPKRKMALVFRSYLGQSSFWANSGVEERKIDYQIWSGPAIGDFNDWTNGSYLEQPENRRVVDIAEHIMRGAAWHTRLSWLRMSGVTLPMLPDYRLEPLE